MATNILTVVNNLQASVDDGGTFTAKQGDADSDFAEGFDVTLTGTGEKKVGTLATATVRKIFDSSLDIPSAPLYFHLWVDGTCYVQVIGSATNYVQKLVAGLPFVIPNANILAAANTTPIAGGAEPSVTAIDKIYIGNYSGSTISYGLAFLF